jgi:opacity protein-like surface antigen
MLLSLMISATANAAALAKGNSEVSGDFNITYNFMQQGEYRSPSGATYQKSETDSLSGIIRVGYGYFLTDALEIGGSAQETITSTKMFAAGANEVFPVDTYTFNLDAFLKYHFIKKGWVVVPFVGVQGGWVNLYQKQTDTVGGNKTSIEKTGNAGSIGGMAGAKIFVTENVAVNAEFNYRHYGVEFKDLPTVKSDVFSWLLGLSYYFGK